MDTELRYPSEKANYGLLPGPFPELGTIRFVTVWFGVELANLRDEILFEEGGILFGGALSTQDGFHHYERERCLLQLTEQCLYVRFYNLDVARNMEQGMFRVNDRIEECTRSCENVLDQVTRDNVGLVTRHLSIR